MSRFFGFAGLVPALFLVGCLSSPTGGPQQPPDTAWQGECDARPASWAVGLTGSDEIIERAWNDSKARYMRIIHPDQAVTMEFNPGRVNLELDRNRVIRAVRCG